MLGVAETYSRGIARRLAAFALITVVLAPAAAARPPRPPPSDYSRYRLDPPADLIYPAGVASADPGVSDPQAVLAADGRGARIERGPADDPVLLVDFGRNVSGVLEVGFTGASGSGVAFLPAERL
jgi:hypothetical protein